MRRGTRNQEPGTRNQEPGTRSQEPGAGNQEPGTGNQEPGTGNREPGARSQEPGARSQEPGTGRNSSPPGERCRAQRGGEGAPGRRERPGDNRKLGLDRNQEPGTRDRDRDRERGIRSRAPHGSVGGLLTSLFDTSRRVHPGGRIPDSRRHVECGGSPLLFLRPRPPGPSPLPKGPPGVPTGTHGDGSLSGRLESGPCRPARSEMCRTTRSPDPRRPGVSVAAAVDARDPGEGSYGTIRTSVPTGIWGNSSRMSSSSIPMQPSVPSRFAPPPWIMISPPRGVFHGGWRRWRRA